MAKLEAAPSNFGGEILQRPDATSQEPAFPLARINFSAVHHFTVALDNGQVWRQRNSDTGVAHFRVGAAVRIRRGFMNSYSLAVEGSYGNYKVKRIK
jgi:hypothetical protein